MATNQQQQFVKVFVYEFTPTMHSKEFKNIVVKDKSFKH